jgi:hypothetical protein
MSNYVTSEFHTIHKNPFLNIHPGKWISAENEFETSS